MGGARVVCLEHRHAIGGDLGGGGLHDEGEGLRTGVIGGEVRQLGPLRLDVTVGLAQRQAVAALGPAAFGQANGRRGEQLGGRLQQARRAPRLELQLGLAQGVLGAASAHDALVERQLEIALDRV
jgi:hypothetical protein